MRMLHFSAESGIHEAVWFTDTYDVSHEDIAEEINEWKEEEWTFDWEKAMEGMATPATEIPYFKAH